MTQRMISCPFCIHLHPRKEGDLSRKCDAFPQGIPDEITFGLAHHTVPWPGDNGIRFEAKDGWEYLTPTLESFDEQASAREQVAADQAAQLAGETV
jgi:hypothetical protein